MFPPKGRHSTNS